MFNSGVRERDDNEDSRLPKRLKMDVDPVTELQESAKDVDMTAAASKLKYQSEDLLPPSRTLLPYKRTDGSVHDVFRISEPDVGISEYMSSDGSRIVGIIKQRYVFEHF